MPLILKKSVFCWAYPSIIPNICFFSYCIHPYLKIVISETQTKNMCKQTQSNFQLQCSVKLSWNSIIVSEGPLFTSFYRLHLTPTAHSVELPARPMFCAAQIIVFTYLHNASLTIQVVISILIISHPPLLLGLLCGVSNVPTLPGNNIKILLYGISIYNNARVHF